MTSTVILDSLVIGAGQAGLATGWHLQKKGLRFVILESSDFVGGSWHLYYDSLKLFTPRRYCALPGMPFPQGIDDYPHRNDVTTYLSEYAKQFNFPIRTGSTVVTVQRENGVFKVTTILGEIFLTKSVVVAAGGFSSPNWPTISGEADFKGNVLHSYAYKSPEIFRGNRVVVVGGGNSAIQIAIELSQESDVTLTTRKPIRYFPSHLLGLDIHFWLRLTRLDQTQLIDDEGTPVLDDGTYKTAIKAGQPRHRPMFTHYIENGVVWPDGEQTEIDAVIYATGYRPTASFLANLPSALNPDGRPNQQRGIATKVPGLYFVGIPKQRNFASATLRGVGPDAAFVTKAIERELNQPNG